LSFIVQIWEQPDGFPPPADLREACDLVDLAAERADPARPNARLRAFQQQILAYWPIIETPPLSYDDPARRKIDLGVWKDDSLRQDLEAEPVMVLAIDTNKVDLVVPWLAEAGPRAGVSVCDPQSGSAWLADGSVFALSDEGASAQALALYQRGDDRAAWERFVELAQRGNRFAFGCLAEMYAEGRFVGRDPVISMALAAVACGWRLVEGLALPPSGQADRATNSLSAARAHRGEEASARADALFARMYPPTTLRETLVAAAHEFDARHVAALDLIAKGNVAAGAMRLQPLADRGHGPSQRTLAHLWSTAQATPEDPKKELAWISAAADLGDPPARFRLAQLYEEGVLVTRSLVHARQLHRLLIRVSGSPAQREASQVELDRLVGPPTGRFWAGRSESELQPLADQGDVAALVELARLIEWARIAAEVWDRSGPLWRRAADAGDVVAQMRMAWACKVGLGAPADEAQATHWYALAARQGNGHGQSEYAQRLGRGLGIARDDRQAVYWLEQAARQRISEALRIMVKGYTAGDLFAKDLLVAQVLLVLHDRGFDLGSDDFHGSDEVDPREVRRMLAEIDGGADLLDVLKRRAQARAIEKAWQPAGGLSLAPVAAASSPRDAVPAAPRDGRLAARVSSRRARVEEPEPEPVVERPPRSRLGPALVIASFFVLAIGVHQLRESANADVFGSWLLGSSLAAAGAFMISRERGNHALVAAMDAAPMFVPFVGSGLAVRMLYSRWRGAGY
jgi:TPR repeat protein